MKNIKATQLVSISLCNSLRDQENVVNGIAPQGFIDAVHRALAIDVGRDIFRHYEPTWLNASPGGLSGNYAVKVSVLVCSPREYEEALQAARDDGYKAGEQAGRYALAAQVRSRSAALTERLLAHKVIG